MLASHLRALAADVDRAGASADGSYLLTTERALELRSAGAVAGRALTQLQALLPAIRLHGGDDEGVRVALRAAHDLADGRASLEHTAEGTREFAAGTAGSLFRNAAAGARAVAEIAEFRSLSYDAFQDAIWQLSSSA
ncbi:MAG: hypothetical protein JWO69_524 [Thermoleophilia bacterium]|nr:hypothetical protein [Thermoleophilia bacterium]